MHNLLCKRRIKLNQGQKAAAKTVSKVPESTTAIVTKVLIDEKHKKQ